MRARRLAFLSLCIAAVTSWLGSSAAAQSVPRRIDYQFVPTAHVQLAIWIESADGTIFRTLGLTDSVAYRGIGNRPGALQMNSGFRWPYGRREGVLPVWAHRRYEAALREGRGGDAAFPRVVFAGRTSEGHASNAGSAGEIVNTRDSYFCLGFGGVDNSLDAISCASPSAFQSNKGRYLTQEMVDTGYVSSWEPFQELDGSGRMRALTTYSLYPPRRDLGQCESCPDHADTRRYVTDARRVMPELDAVTMATPPRDVTFMRSLVIPSSWPDGEYVLYVEANTERDYDEPDPRVPGDWDDSRYPTPNQPQLQGNNTSAWDYWAENSGWPYRGQPSIVYALPILVSQVGGNFTVSQPMGYGEIHGLDGDIRPMDPTIVNDPIMRAGSGSDRLRLRDGARLRAHVPTVNVCAQVPPPPQCDDECSEVEPCPDGFVCGEDRTCIGICDLELAPGAPKNLRVEQFADRRHSHEYVTFEFVVPESMRGLSRYEIRVSREPLTDPDGFSSWGQEAKAALPIAPGLVVPVRDERGELLPAGTPGQVIRVDMGGLEPETGYYLAMRVSDDCGAWSEVAQTELETTSVRFTTVSPCFVATAAYGDPLDARIGILRRLRDRHLMSSSLGRAVVSVYETLGPHAAEWIAVSEERRAAARAVLEPIVSLLEWVD